MTSRYIPVQFLNRAKIIRHYYRKDYFSNTGMPLCAMEVSGSEPDRLIHDHDFTELVVVIGGSGLHLTAQGPYPIQAGDVFVIHENTRHAYQDAKNLHYVNVLFDLKRLNLTINDLTALEGYQAFFVLEPRLRTSGGAHHHCRLSAADLAILFDLLTNLIRELDKKEIGYRSLAAGLFLLILGFLSRCYSRIRDPEPRALLRLGHILGYIDNHYAEPVTLNQLARLAAMSPSTLYRTFQRSFRTSPVNYIINIRIQKSLALLTGGEMNVTETAFRVGFADSNYFARQFRKRMGLSPREFQRRYLPRVFQDK